MPGCPEACAQEPLHGKIQTAQRAELRAFVAALERTAGNVVVWSDSKYVVRGARRIARGVSLPSSHVDLWERAQQAWLLGTTQVHWIKAHLDWPSAQQRGFPRDAWAGNQKADELAGLGAAVHAPPAADVTRVLKVRTDTRRAHRWMAAAIPLVADDGDLATKPPCRRRPQRAESGRRAARPVLRGPPGDHPDVQLDGDCWKCAACHRRVRRTRGWRVWRRIPCKPVRRPFPQDGPAAPPGDVLAGRVAHSLRTESGYTTCLLCGLSRQSRWRSKLGLLCQVMPGVPAADPGIDELPAVAAPPPPAPHAMRPRRRTRQDLLSRLESHSIVVAEGWHTCTRAGCGRRLRARERSRFSWCTSDGAPVQPPDEG